ncbi:hypothetical protein [Pedobacter duraquae]|uniref:Uncharacterized protein n=1 Tax=Pedobacter duraquae TaxID=425511 RepID=A0A4V3C3F6_9SPHI|nr:hypothetical protein [Pedobacter duraquae]TDO21878.1 hypothetical protein CLV32_2986 [Pedobacter duraquae]
MRTTNKQVVKNYDTDTFNGWALSYEYESQNNTQPIEIKVVATKGAGSVYVSKISDSMSINLGGGADLDTALIENIKTEFDAIKASFSETK